jgi:hypothetical protein
MDAERFDALTRTVTATASRRRALRGLVGGVLGGVAGSLGLRETAAVHQTCALRHARARCRRGNQCCSGICRRRRCRCPQGGYCAGGGGSVSACGPEIRDDCFCVVSTAGPTRCALFLDFVCPASKACDTDGQCDDGWFCANTAGCCGSAGINACVPLCD